MLYSNTVEYSLVIILYDSMLIILYDSMLIILHVYHVNSVNGGWSVWSDFGQCSVTCGIGLKTQHRTCTNPAPAFGGTQCDGDQHQDSICINTPCASKYER